MSKRKRKRAHWSVQFQSYSERNQILKGMGYDTYAEYLASDLWASIRLKVMGPDQTCHLCDRLATTVHHLYYDYAVLSGISLSALVPVCEGCHVRIEFNPNGSKRTIPEAYDQYLKMGGRRRPNPRKGALGPIAPRDHCAVCRSTDGVAPYSLYGGDVNYTPRCEIRFLCAVCLDVANRLVEQGRPSWRTHKSHNAAFGVLMSMVRSRVKKVAARAAVNPTPQS